MSRSSMRFNRRRQGGISLVVVLILLLIMTLLGLAVLRSTLLEERMSANLYDRSLAFQVAEAGLREAETVVRTAVLNGTPIGFDCTGVGVSCPAIAPNAYTGNVAGCAANDQNCWRNGVTTQTLSNGALPQYYVEYQGQKDSTDVLGLGSSAAGNQYGGGGGAVLEKLYRVTARSSDPSTGSRSAVVVLQSNISIK